MARLLNLSTQKDDNNKRFCPFCESKVHLDKFDRHISSCYNISKEGSILKMPEEGATMKFKNSKAHRNLFFNKYLVLKITKYLSSMN